MLTAIERLRTAASYNWSLEMLGNVGGLHIVLEWNDFDSQYENPGYSWAHLYFVGPASFALVDYSQMLQFPPDDSGSKVLNITLHSTNASHVVDIELNTMSVETGWHRYRVVAFDDAVDVISKEPPQVRLSENAPKIMEWWSQGRPDV